MRAAFSRRCRACSGVVNEDSGAVGRGVLSTPSAWVMDLSGPLAWVRAGAEVRASPRLAFVISQTMTKSIRDSKKSKPKIGRPKTTGPGQAQVVRMHDQQIAAIDAWIALQDTEISRPEAIRRLVELGLANGKRSK
jgi:hypothetical protein